MTKLTLVDRGVNISAFNDARKSDDMPGMVAAVLSFTATSSNKPLAFSAALGGLSSSVTSLSDKLSDNKGVKLSDVMAAQAAVGAVIGLGAELVGEKIGARDKKTGALVSGVGRVKVSIYIFVGLSTQNALA